MKDINFNNHRDLMTDSDKQEIFELLSKGLRQKNRDLLHRRLFNHLNMIPYHGILSRIMKESHGWTYCCGQSWNDEMRTLRKIILELK